jgi:hypothetical protein
MFAVWYPIDNWVDVFDSDGNSLGHIEGCLPEALAVSYSRQGRSGAEWQSYVISTLGVGVDSAGEIRVASFQRTGEARTIRVRRYRLGAGLLEERDYEVTDLKYSMNRLLFTTGTGALAFSSSSSAELGIRKLQMR